MTQAVENAQKILNTLDENIVQETDNQIKNLKICKTVCPQTLPDLDENMLKKVMQAHEIALRELLDVTENSGCSNIENKEFNRICKKCVDIMQAISIPNEPVRKYMHILKMISYAYLGDRWENVRRYLNYDQHVQSTVKDTNSDWNRQVLSDISRAVMCLAKKESLEDLKQVGEIIRNLRVGQKIFEKSYLADTNGRQVSAADELAALYHLAKSVEQVGEFMMQGTPTDAEEQVDFHFMHAKSHAQISSHIEMDIILFVLHAALKKMMRNSIWNLAKAVPNLEMFITKLTESKRPVFEFMHPQQVALNEGLLDPAKMAVVVDLPTSSGKTLMAEFRILQTLSMSKCAKVAYVVPTKALVNQITSKLRRDLGKLGIKTEKMSGAIEIGEFEEDIVRRDEFQILVTTPEKLQLLIKHPNNEFARSLRLIIIDEAHNMADVNRGFTLEMLISTIKHDCNKAHFLLMSPSIPNSDDLARWLDPANSKAISMELDWAPNDRVIGAYYTKGARREIHTFFKPLISESENINMNEILIKSVQDAPYTASSIPKYKLTALLSTQLRSSQNLLILAGRIDDTWKIAKEITDNSPKQEDEPPMEIQLVMKFVAAEMGQNFPLNKYLEKRVAVHHAGLSDEVRSLVEWLMENRSIHTLVTTTTIAEGINFPISGMLINTYTYYNAESRRSESMPVNDFWNLVGRVGRMEQSSIGMIGIASNKSDIDKISKYLKGATDNLISHLKNMMEDAHKINKDLNLPELAGDPNWSRFLQYIAHIKNQSENLDHFNMRIDSTLRRTYGYNQISPIAQKNLTSAVHKYAQKLDDNPALAKISDITGFAPESVDAAISKMSVKNIKPKDWLPENLFAKDSKISELIMIMVDSIPEVVNVKEWMNKKNKDSKEVSQLVTDWVSGASVEDIARRHFRDSEDDMTDCVKSIYKIITNSITWGIAGIQKIPGSGIDDMTTKEEKQASNIPAMIHYGVNTKEAVLMRMNNVPRRIATRIGELYHNANSVNVLNWLDELPDDKWSADGISGADYKMIWKILAGRV